MLHGDLSNSVRASFGFMLSDFVLEYKDTKVTDKILNAVFGKAKRAELNKRAIHSMEYIYRQTEYNVDLLIQEDEYTQDIKSIIEDLPFCRVVLYNKYSQITSRLLTGDLTYVVDKDPYRMGLMNHSHVISLDTLDNLLRGGRNQ